MIFIYAANILNGVYVMRQAYKASINKILDLNVKSKIDKNKISFIYAKI